MNLAILTPANSHCLTILSIDYYPMLKARETDIVSIRPNHTTAPAIRSDCITNDFTPINFSVLIESDEH